MKRNFNIEVDLSLATDKFEWNDYNCTIESDKILRTYGYQYGFIDTQSDENVILIHRILDEKKVKKLVSEIGFNYFIADE